MLRKAILPLTMGVALATASIAAGAVNAHCFSYCPDRAGWTYEGCTVYMDDEDNITNVECEYSYRAWIAE
jgi:hypothetical protein